jgi:hypothetical protein
MPSFFRNPVFFFLISFSATLVSAQVNAHFDCTPSFPYQAPWLGADVGYSVPLPDGRDFWIFGDTLYGDKRQVTGDDPRMVRNTVGISTCKNGKWKIDYTIRRGSDSKFVDFFQAQKPATWYWALSGAEHNNELWVSNLCVRNEPKATSAAMGFAICGTDLAHVTSLGKDPQKWKIAYFPLTGEAEHVEAGSAALAQGDHLYLFSLWETGDGRPEILVRIPWAADDPRKQMEYLGSDDQWHAGLEPTKAKLIMTHGASEMSVNYHAEVKKWIAVMVDPNIFSDKVLLRTAPSMTGPWTEGEVIYHVPELQKDNPHYDKDTFCYAGKEHPEFEKPGELVFTYVCNSMKPKKLETEPYIYTPQVVRMPMPASVTAK